MPAPDAEGADRPRLCLSRCLLGERVRYDGGHKLDPFLRDTLGHLVDFVPVCPEKECGLPVPREPMRLVGTAAAPRLLGVSSNTDFTQQMETWITDRLENLAADNLWGCVFKSKSPSCGMERVKVYAPGDGARAQKGSGLWTRRFMKRYPLLPVEDEARLHDPELRDNFFERIFAMQRLRALSSGEKTLHRLSEFHACHRYQLQAHSEPLLRQMERVLADAAGKSLETAFSAYARLFSQALRCKATARKQARVLARMLGQLKKGLSEAERKELRELIEACARGEAPLHEPITLISHYARAFDLPVLRRQWYLAPHPLELRLKRQV